MRKAVNTTYQISLGGTAYSLYHLEVDNAGKQRKKYESREIRNQCQAQRSKNKIINETVRRRDSNTVGFKQEQTRNVQDDVITHEQVSGAYLYKPLDFCVYGLIGLIISLKIKTNHGYHSKIIELQIGSRMFFCIFFLLNRSRAQYLPSRSAPRTTFCMKKKCFIIQVAQ